MNNRWVWITGVIVGVGGVAVCGFCLVCGVFALLISGSDNTTSSRLADIAEQSESRPSQERQLEFIEPGQEGDQPQNLSEAPAQATELQALAVTKSGFGQDGRDIGFGFIIQNPNISHAFESTRYQVALYDAAGVVVDTESGFVEIVLPGQSLGVAGRTFLDEGITATRIEVQLQSDNSDAVASEQIPTFQVNSATYIPDDITPLATGQISSPYDQDLENVRVSFISYDGNGAINGGGFTFTNFILARSSTGVHTSITTSGEPTNIELYPSISGLTFLGSQNTLPEGAQNINLLKSGYGQDDSQIGFGFILENPNPAKSIENSQYRITLYAEDGRVLKTDEGYMEILLPAQTIGIAGETFVDEVVSRAEVQILAGDFLDEANAPSFNSENVNYIADDFSSSITGEIINLYGTDVSDIRASAIAYDANNNIIGGGFTFVDFVPGNGRAAAEVSVTTSAAPANVELYGILTSLSDFE